MDPETRQAIKRLAAAVDSLAGMTAGLAAYLALVDGAAHVDRRKAVGLSLKLVPEGLSGAEGVSPARAASAMVEQLGSMAEQLKALKTRIDRPPPQVTVESSPVRDASGQRIPAGMGARRG